MAWVSAVAQRLAYALLGAAVLASAWAWDRARQPAPGPVAVPVPATPARVLTRIERVTVPCATVQAYQPAAKAALRLPAAVRADPAAHVLAASEVPAGERDTRLSTVLDTATGAVETYAETLPSPWLRAEQRRELGLSYGLKSGASQPVWRVDGQVDLLQTKALHWGLAATADTDGDWFAGLRVSGRW